MGKIFINQTYLKIRLTADVNINGATETKIYYRKPDGTVSSVDANVESAAEGIIYYDVAPASTLLDQTGVWYFWAYVEFSDGRMARGETVRQQIYDDEE